MIKKNMSSSGLASLISAIKSWCTSKFLDSENVEEISTVSIEEAPTKDSTNLISSGAVYSALQQKQDNVVFEDTYDPIVNRAATRVYVENAVAGWSATGTPIIVDDISKMTNTDRLYVLTTNQHVYQYDNGWKDTGVSYSGGNVVQTEGVSYTDVMSQNATTAALALKVDGAFVEDGYLYLTSNDEVVAGPLGPFSGGGGSGSTYIITLTNLLPSRIINTALDNDVFIDFEYSSVDSEDVDDGPGVGTLTVNGSIVRTFTVDQGYNHINVRNYLSSGSNAIKISVVNSDGASRVLAYTVNAVSLLLTTTFDDMGIYTNNVIFNYTITGEGTKKIFFRVDGLLVGTDEVDTSGRARTFNLPSLTDGAHHLTVYAETSVQGETIRSNNLDISIIYASASMTQTAILMNASSEQVVQGETLIFDYMVFNPLSERTAIDLVILNNDGTEYSRIPVTVDRLKHNWSTDTYPAGDIIFKIDGGSVSASKQVDVEEYILPVSKVTEGLELEFDPTGRHNNEEHPDSWSYNEYSGTFSGFGWSEADGWLTDDESAAVLRFIPGDSLDISLMPFASDVRETGYTIEAEFATHNVRDYDSVIVDCFNNGRGFEIKSQNTHLASEQTSLSMQFKEDSKVRITFSIEQKNQNRFVYIYVNGIMCNVNQYPISDNFAQQNPETIVFGADSCGLDLYRLRCYKKALTAREQLDNYIVDRPTLSERISAYNDNNIMGTDETVRIDMLPQHVPVMIIESPQLPTDKNADDIKGAYVTFTDRLDSSKSFIATNVALAVQGTSSAGYPVKNFKVKMLKDGGSLIVDGEEVTEGYRIKDDIAPIKTICLKADYASSEGANNVELVDLYNEICPWTTPPEEVDSEVRQGIYGRPIAVFWKNTNTNKTSFVGKYNMNWDKSNPKAFGFNSAYPNAESWEFLDNAVDLCLFKTDNMLNWQNAFEARYPDTKPAYSDLTRLSRVVGWVASTRRDAASGNALPSSVTYEGITYTHDTADYRLAKFKAEFEDYFIKDSAIFYYLFTEVFLMVDSRAKNMFLTTYDGIHWGFLPYDFDTALGINNEGELVFDYNLEDTDSYAGGVVFNGQDSVLWNNLRDAFKSDIKAAYKTLRSNQKFRYQYVSDAFEAHQDTWPIALWNEDAFLKYLNPYLSSGTDNLAMLQGSKASQRDWWLYNGFRYRDSKYETGDANNYIQMRAFEKDDITLTPYSHVYAKVEFGNDRVTIKRTTRNTPVVLSDPSPDPWAAGTDTVVRIYSADRIASLGDLSGLNVGTADFSGATKLQSLKLGSDDTGYANTHLTALSVGNNELLSELDISNCTNMSQTIDLSGCVALETVKASGTAITGITLPSGGHLKSLILPASMANLTIHNQSQFETLIMPSYNNITTLNIEKTPSIPFEDIILGCQENSRIRLIDVEWTATNADSLAETINKLNQCQGISESGSNLPNAVVTGRVYVDSVSEETMENIAAHYPQLVVIVQGLPQYIIRFVNYDASVLFLQVVPEGGNAYDPVTPGHEPAKPGTDLIHYTFDGWDSIPVDVHESQVVTAQYEDNYRVRFFNYDDSLLQTSYARRGTTAIYSGPTPVQPSTAKYDFTFYAWSGDLTSINEPTDTTALYTSIIRSYTISFANNDGTVLQSGLWEYDTTPVYRGSQPKHSENPDDWEWVGWNPSVSVVTGDQTYTAKYRSLLGPAINNSWYRSTKAKSSITSISFVPNYVPISYDETWDASEKQAGDVIGYIIGSDLYVTWSSSGYDKLKCGIDCSNLFYSFNAVTTIDISQLDFSETENLFCAFGYCSKLTNIVGLNHINTINVTSFSYMFNECICLESLDLSSFNTSNATTMARMFYNCQQLLSIDVSMFNTNKVSDMSQMFGRCSKIKELDLSNFDTSAVSNMSSMFNGTVALKSLNISSFNTSAVTRMDGMFQSTGLESIDLSNFNTNNVTTMQEMFYYCRQLTYLNISNFNTSKVTTIYCMFNNCQKLPMIDIHNFDFHNMTVIRDFISRCNSLTALIVGASGDIEPQPLVDGFERPTLTYIYVPDHLVDAYKAATNWSYYADYILPQSSLPTT